MTSIELRKSNNSGKVDLKTLVTSVAFLLQLGALIWGAAKLSASVEMLSTQSEALARSQKDITSEISRIQQFNAVLEVRLKHLEADNTGPNRSRR